ncbi:unnamed protein product [Peronospora belbahrii]|uniref:Uncharacterized protein n=1 Tax=Peronospora belbahrii TaxID=622444 RepID=A0AAU9LEF8_9STRA|nr:unnamed protein product [Peronospora belbahrii]CAH0520909.1 unnamed protein product [Peronospora belbahrii]
MGNRVTLHSACKNGDLVEFQRLLKTATSEDLEAMDNCGRTPLLLAVAGLKHLHKHQELDANPNDLHGVLCRDEKNTIISLTAEGHEQDQESNLEANGGTDSSYSETVDEMRDNANMGLLPKELEILRLLLQRRVNVDHKDENDWTALHHGCFVQNAVAIKMLIHAGAQPMRDSYGLLPQDLLQRGHMPDWVAQAQELKESLDQMTANSVYAMKLLAFRPSGIVQLDMGGQVEKGSFVTLEYDVPETHSVKDYVQVLISEEDSAEINTGPFHFVPAGGHGQITISTKDIPSSSTVRFVYVKSDINSMCREVVASGCNAVVQASVGEIFQYELFVYDRVVEVESVLEFEFVDQPLIVLKRIGIVMGKDIDWVTIRSDNHIVAVNDIRIDTMDFAKAVRVLQENNGRQCTKLLMQNFSVCGDFIPEKILGIGVIGKYAYLHPLDAGQEMEGDEQTHEAWVRDSNRSDNVKRSSKVATNEQLRAEMVSALPSAVQFFDEPSQNYLPPSASLTVSQAEAFVPVSKTIADDNDDPATMSKEENVSSFSTIETMVPLPNSLQLVAQLQHGISVSHANR